MAEKFVSVKYKLRYSPVTEWTTADPVLLAGEPGVSVLAVEGKQPVVLVKIGDGTHKWSELPFLSGIASDVYDWAKAESKPTYDASEITGLADYIGNTIEDTDTQYKFTQGENAQTYLFQSKQKDADDTTWTTVSTLVIPEGITYTVSSTTAGKLTVTPSKGDAYDVTVVDVKDAKTDIVKTDTTQAVPSVKAVAEFVEDQMGSLDFNDTAEAGKFVTSVKRADGTFTVTRKEVTVAEIADLVFNGTYNKDTNKAATMKDVADAVAKAVTLQGIVAKVADLPDPTAEGSTVKVGDMYHVSADNSEYVAIKEDDGTVRWESLGTIFDASNLVTLEKLQEELDKKQDKITAENKLPVALVDGVATKTTDGLMSASDKSKLDDVEATAQVNKIEKVIAGDTVLPIEETDKSVTFAKIASTGNVNDLIQTAGDVLILDGGNAAGDVSTPSALVLNGGNSSSLS